MLAYPRLWRRFINIKNFEQERIKELAHKPQNLVFILLFFIVVFYFQTVASLYTLWTSDGNWEYSHGVLGFLLSTYIFFKEWIFKSADFPYKINKIGFLFLFSSVVLWLLASIGNIQIVQQLALLGVVSFLFWSIFGYSAFSLLILPILIILTAVPIWGFLNFYLQQSTILGVSFLLKTITTIPFLRDGFLVVLPNGTFEVADVCSGLRMVTAIVPVALFYIYLNNIRWQAGIIYVVAAVLVAIIANVIRIFIVVVAGYLTDMQHYFVTTDHVSLGWVVFGVVVIGFIYIGNKVFSSEKIYAKISSKQQNKKVVEMSQAESMDKVIQSKSKIARILILGAFVAGIGPVVASILKAEKYDGISREFNLESDYGAWKKSEQISKNWIPEYHGYDLDNLSQYENTSNEKVKLYLAHYFNQTQGKEVIYYKNKLFQPDKWKISAYKHITADINDIGEINMEEFKIISPGGEAKIVWRWNFIYGYRVSGELKTKLLEIFNKLKGNSEITVFILATDLDVSYDDAINRLKSFLSNSLPSIEVAVTELQ